MRRALIAAALLALAAAAARAQPAPAARDEPAQDAVGRAYDARLRQSFAAAEALQGPLDGGWRVIGPHGRELLRLQLVDKGDGVVEGAWRDLRGAAGSGLIAPAPTARGRARLAFGPPGSAFRLELRRGPAGGWRGRLRRGGEVSAVALARLAP
jgi:hypothetical protein